MSKRINIVLPDKTVDVLDQVTTKGNRSQLIETDGKPNLRARLKEEGAANTERDLAIAADWFPLEEEAEGLAGNKRSRKPARKRA